MTISPLTWQGVSGEITSSCRRNFFRCHRSDKLKKLLGQQWTDLVVIPGGMTSQLQVLDVCINKIFKEGIQRQWNTWMMYENHSFTAGGRIKKPDLLLIT